MKTLKELAEYNNIDTIKKSANKLWPLIYKPGYKISEFKIFQSIYLLPYKCSFRGKGNYCVNKVFLGGLLIDDKTILPINISSNKQKTIKFRGDNT